MNTRVVAYALGCAALIALAAATRAGGEEKKDGGAADGGAGGEKAAAQKGGQQQDAGQHDGGQPAPQRPPPAPPTGASPAPAQQGGAQKGGEQKGGEQKAAAKAGPPPMSTAPGTKPEPTPPAPPVKLWSEDIDPVQPPRVEPNPPDSPPRPSDPVASRRCLAREPVFEREMTAARVAWKYFENNYQPKTGLVNAVDQYPSTTMWDLASSLAGTIAARELGFVEAKEFDERITGMLATLNTMPLFEDTAPNKAYSAATGEMTDYTNKPSQTGIGFSALDLGRLVSWLQLLSCIHPEYRAQAERVLARWNWCGMVKDGELYGATYDPGSKKSQRVQEGRYGYEQYAGKAFGLLGLEADVAARYDNRYWAATKIYDVPIAFDVRDVKKTGAHNYVVTESYALDALEFGIDDSNRQLIENVYEVQRRRFEQTGLVTAASEDNVDRAPYFVYNTIFSDGTPWNAITDTGADATNLRSVSTKAAFSLVTLFPDRPYSGVLLQSIENAWTPDKGWYAGVYENGLGYNRAVTANTNGIILELALYRMFGPLQRICRRCQRGLGDIGATLTPEEREKRCTPGAKPAAKPPAPRPSAGK